MFIMHGLVIERAPICSISGYVSTRVFLSIGGQDWQKNIFFTATVLPRFALYIALVLVSH